LLSCALFDHRSHFTQGCGNTLLVSQIIRSCIGSLLTLYVRDAIHSDPHEIIQHIGKFRVAICYLSPDGNCIYMVGADFCPPLRGHKASRHDFNERYKATGELLNAISGVTHSVAPPARLFCVPGERASFGSDWFDRIIFDTQSENWSKLLTFQSKQAPSAAFGVPSFTQTV
jgi:hypothetical protein